jgi:NADPH:quinone reductase-like Zn-dependent oxidoreductase
VRAAVVERYGPPEVVSVRDLPDPVAAKGQVVVRVRATTVNSGDARIRGCRFPRGFAVPGRLALGWSGPRRAVLGVVHAGVVESVGPGVTGISVGD